jgi:ABC-2 type transport system ATP-binding protein/lipopolysaccharide transport system ATP-binding protein
MPDNAIEVSGVSKRYRVGAKAANSLREALTNRLSWRSSSDPSREVWSLRDVSFEVGTGEVIGVVGRNGAGKSTLLKILSRITEPTKGVSRTRGRVASLLEVGTGFHIELTGRENVFLNGAILGLTRREISARFDDIVEFSGVGRFIDTPIKRYSSGMYLRLAFAVAAHVEPDILIVDEVLAVGDSEFQRKCLAGMSTVGAQGRTVVLVSHDLDAIARLCPRTLWIDRGVLRKDGDTGPVLDAYLRTTREEQTGYDEVADVTSRVIVHRVAATDRSGRESSVLRRDVDFIIEIEFSLTERIPGFDIALYVINQRGVRVFDETWSDTESTRVDAPGRYVVRLSVPAVLNVGEYSVGVWIGSGFEELLSVDAMGSFTLDGSTKGRPDRVVELLLPWEAREIGPPSDPGPSAEAGSV